MLSYVPRIVWADKPDMTTGLWVTANFGAGPNIKSHTAPTWIGELYFNFGWPGIIIGMLVDGGVHADAARSGLPSRRRRWPAQMMAVAGALRLSPDAPGGLIAPVNGVVFGALPIVFTHWFVRFLGGAPAGAARTDELAGTSRATSRRASSARPRISLRSNRSGSHDPLNVKLLAFAAGFLISLALGELLLRFFPAFDPQPRIYVGDESDRPSANFVADPEIGWRMRPDHEFVVDTTEYHVAYRSNAQGFRDAHAPD